MAELKQLLKDAKNALASEDYEQSIEKSKEVLNLDKNNYFAHVFLGKAFSCTGDLAQSKKHYKAAIDMDPGNMLAWKGIFMLFRTANIAPTIVSFDEFFDLCGEYAEHLVQQQLPMVDLVNDIRNFKNFYRDCQESYLRHMRPGTPMAERLSRHLITPQDALQGLLNIVSAEEQQQVSKLVSRERLKISANQPDYNLKVNSIAWQVYQDSEIDELYQQLINITDDDEKRRGLESKWLEYRIRVLKSMPADIKHHFFTKVRNMVEDMVVVDHDFLLAWQLYFEWQDYSDLDCMDVNVISKFLKKFPKEPLAAVLYAWVCSEQSSYNSKEFYEKTFQGEDTDNSGTSSVDSINDVVEDGMDESEKRRLQQLVDPSMEEATFGLSEDEVLLSLTENIKKTQQSIVAHRIVSHYYVSTREYESALHYTKAGIVLCAQSVKNMGAHLSNSKRELTLDLATTYTYFEAPKNHPTALALFEKLLTENSDNVHAKMGKGLIAIERRNWQEAYELLKEVTERYPDNYEVLSEFAWSELHLDAPDAAIERFKYILNNVEGSDLKVLEFRSLNHWRMAKGYVYKQHGEINAGESSEKEYIKLAFKQLVQAVKTSENFAPGYSTLGDIYSEYYQDPTRAFKCYFKSFEMDPSDLTAARYMCEKYCGSCDWQSASLIAERVVKAEKSKSILQNVNWPYRVLGIAHLEKQAESESIEWFQSALRVEPADLESWLGLGQAYYSCGRVEASVKVFEKALEVSPGNAYAHYFKALSLSKMGLYDESIEIFRELTAEHPDEESYQVSMVEVLVEHCNVLCSQGFLTRSVAAAADAIRKIESIVLHIDYKIHGMWLSLSNALRVICLVQSQVHLLPLESLVNIFEVAELRNTDEIDKIDHVTLSGLLSDLEQDNVAIAAQFLVLSGKHAIACSDYASLPRTVRASLWYNLGIVELMAFVILKSNSHRDAAIESFKKSIEYQSNTAEAWIGFGIASIDLNVRVAQHCFIKATALNPRETSVWYDMAILALRYNDVAFARAVLMKSQSIAPQDSTPWFGLALASEKEGLTQDSARLFAHSFVLSNGKSKGAQLLYAKSVLKTRIGSGDDERDIGPGQELSAVAYGLDDYLKKNPDDKFALQCAILTLERLRNYAAARKLSDRLLDILEKRFEKAQDDSELFHFAIVKSQLARVYLGLKDYETAIESADLSLGILAEHNNEVAEKCITSNHAVMGLASFFLDDFDQTLEHFKVLLDRPGESKQLVILVAKILYNVESEETREVALKELVDYINSNGPDLTVTLTIAVISLLEGIPDDMRAILSELKSLPLSDMISDRHRDIPFLIQQLNTKLSQDCESQQQWQRTAFFFPNDSGSWGSLDKKIRARIAAGGQNKVPARKMSEFYSSLGNLSKIQRSIFLCPWNKEALSSLKGCF
ncbi:SKI complex subunit tetratricopeptide repeat protein SKI3 [Lachancea thermotolerans CBS 6340]|uniref:KLTH0A00638p n=1 Tax=Lachancea thermotolerans (strain ATCC 56472 / CBS 6340 / NRRL Y-8284) TaxID=559295 RepID=C5DB91_LACTC|nr:KLTH0A00638p [Lachancea thermotolerans CBS 6340]CAR21048.1 KLTH0A00638p [Lachancea thermotolerans CBS 6340]